MATEQGYQITPKGMLAYVLSKHLPGKDVYEIAAICDEWFQAIKNTMDRNEQRGIPAVVFDNGWHLVEVCRGPKND